MTRRSPWRTSWRVGSPLDVGDTGWLIADRFMLTPTHSNLSSSFSTFSRRSVSFGRILALVGAGLLLLAVLESITYVPHRSMPLPVSRVDQRFPLPLTGSKVGPNMAPEVVGLLWARQVGTPAYDEARSVATDSSGVYVTGSTQGTLPGQTSAGEIGRAHV